MQDTGIITEQRGGVLRVSFRGEGRKNALNPETVIGLAEVFEMADPVETRAMVLSGYGENFSSGANVSRMRAVVDAPPETTPPPLLRGHRLLRAIANTPIPVIAAVEGDAFGAGLSCACACDYLVAARTARFGAAFTKVGLMPDMGLLYTLPARVGPGAARRILMLSEPFMGEAAARLGLVDELVDHGKAVEVACDLASLFSAVAPLPVAIIKRVMQRMPSSLEDVLRVEAEEVSGLLNSDDHREGVLAFREKRPPVFKSK